MGFLAYMVFFISYFSRASSSSLWNRPRENHILYRLGLSYYIYNGKILYIVESGFRWSSSRWSETSFVHRGRHWTTIKTYIRLEVAFVYCDKTARVQSFICCVFNGRLNIYWWINREHFERSCMVIRTI